MRPDLPEGPVTLLFTDIEGSTQLLRELGADAYARVLSEHRRAVRDACRAAGGVEVDSQGDAFFVVFPDAKGAAAASLAITGALRTGPIRLRIGMHSGHPLPTDEGYVGSDVHLAARVAAAGHGGQILVTAPTAELLGDRSSLLPLGEHRLKDIVAPVELFQLGEGAFPPLRSLSVSTLPRPATPFVGRARELTDVATLLGGGARLVTLTGPGGIGKTRLAIESAAAAVLQFDAGAHWVDLASLRDPSLVMPTIAQTLGARGPLAEHIGGRRFLLLLDNLEQVIEAASGLAGLVEACPQLVVLATSRERLRVRGEREYRVQALDPADAVSLFTERSGIAATPDVDALCRRLDELPLAIELAAARARVLSPAGILKRLPGRLDLLVGGRDADPRQATLRATIGWSHDLLDEDERQAFRRFSVFATGAVIEAVEDVTGADLDLLQSLVDKSLITVRGDRFRMLQTVRDFALEQLAASPDTSSVQRSHAAWYAGRVEQADRGLDGREQEIWLERLTAEHDDVRAALGWAIQDGDSDLALRLASSAATYWWITGSMSEGRRWLDAALALPGSGDAALRAAALEGAAHLALRQSDPSAAKPMAEESLALRRGLHDPRGLARSLRIAALLAFWDGHREDVRKLTTESSVFARQAGDDWVLLMDLNNLGYIALEERDAPRAAPLFGEALELARRRGDARSEAFVLENLALTRLTAGEPGPARALYAQSLGLAVRLGFLEVEAADIAGLASIASLAGDPVSAARLLGAAERIFGQTGGQLDTVEAAAWAGVVEWLQTELPHDEFQARLDEGRALTPEERRALALEVGRQL